MFLKQVAQLMKMLKTIHDHKRKQERAVMRERAAQHQKQQAHIEASRSVKRKERAKHAFYRLGQLEKRQNMDSSWLVSQRVVAYRIIEEFGGN